MQILLAVLAGIAVLAIAALALALRIVQQYQEGVLFRLGRVVGLKKPGLIVIVPHPGTRRLPVPGAGRRHHRAGGADERLSLRPLTA